MKHGHIYFSAVSITHQIFIEVKIVWTDILEGNKIYIYYLVHNSLHILLFSE